MHKKSIFTIIVLLIVLNIVTAGNIYPVNLSTNEEQQIQLTLHEGIELNEPKGIIIFNKLNKDESVNLKFFRADNRLWGTFAYKLREPKLIDMNHDGKEEIVLTVYALEGGKIFLSIKSLETSIKENIEETEKSIAETLEKTTEPITGQVVTNLENKPEKSVGFLITVLIIITGVLVYLSFVRKKSS